MEKIRNQKGVTLVALVVTIIVLIILAGISINLLLGDNGLITKAKETKKQQKIAEIKEKISLELSAAETDAILRNESLEQEQLNDIVSKYGTLQEDKDTILTKDDNYEISLKEIWYGTLSTSGNYSDKKKQIEMLEKELEKLNKKYKELEEINSGNNTILNNLRNQITTLENEKKALEESLKTEQEKNKNLETQIAELNNKYDNLKQEYDKFTENPGTATADDIAEGMTAWVNGELIIGNGSEYSEGYDSGKSSVEKIDTIVVNLRSVWGGGTSGSTLNIKVNYDGDKISSVTGSTSWNSDGPNSASVSSYTKQ